MAKKKEVSLTEEKKLQWRKSFKLKELARLKRIRVEAANELQKIDARINKVEKELEELKDVPELKNWYSPF